MKEGNSGKALLIALLVGLVTVAGGLGLIAQAQTADSEVVREQLQQLIDEGYLQEAIEKGIDAYIVKQRATAEAREQSTQAARAKNLRPVSADRDHIYGAPDAPITVVEYSDYECPFCKRFHGTVKQLVDDNPGKVNWVYRHFPLEFHNPGAQKQAEATECAAEQGGNEAFWRYSDLIFERTTSNGNGFPIGNLVPLAEEIGLDASEFGDCLDSGRMAARVAEDYENGVQAGITGTPGNIIVNNNSGERLVQSGAVPLARLRGAVEQLSQ